MKSILFDTNEELLIENIEESRLVFTAKMASLQNLSERLANIDSKDFKTKSFETILVPGNRLQVNYKTLLNQSNFEEQIEATTQTLPNKINKLNKKAKKIAKNVIAPIPKLKQISKPSSLVSSSRSKAEKIVKHVTIADKSIEYQKELKKLDEDLVKMMFKQFSVLILEQWEEAADGIIDEFIEEEVYYLNSIEEGNNELQ